VHLWHQSSTYCIVEQICLAKLSDILLPKKVSVKAVLKVCYCWCILYPFHFLKGGKMRPIKHFVSFVLSLGSSWNSNPSPWAGILTNVNPSHWAGILTNVNPSPWAGILTNVNPSHWAGILSLTNINPSAWAGFLSPTNINPSPWAGILSLKNIFPSPWAGILSLTYINPSPWAGVLSITNPFFTKRLFSTTLNCI
jgi:hypothetical protein